MTILNIYIRTVSQFFVKIYFLSWQRSAWSCKDPEKETKRFRNV